MIAFNLAVLTSIWVYLDSQKVGFIKDPNVKSFKNMGPRGWALGCLLLWIVFFPLYLTERRKRIPTDSAKGLSNRSLAGTLAFAVLLGLAFGTSSLEFDIDDGDSFYESVESMKTYCEKSDDATQAQIELFKFLKNWTAVSIASIVQANPNCTKKELQKKVEQFLKPFDGIRYPDEKFNDKVREAMQKSEKIALSMM